MAESSTTASIRKRLQQAESLTAEAQRLAGVGIWHYHIKSGILFWSEEQYRIFGVSPQDYVPTVEGYLSFVHPDDLDDVLRRRAEINAEEMTVIEHRIIRRDGEIRYLHHRTQIAQMDGYEGLSRVGVIQDVTERRRSEAMLIEQGRRMQEMQSELVYLSRLSAMGTMAATLGHELNQPLTAVVNYAGVARRALTSAPQQVELALESLGEILESAHRAAEIIRSLRDMARRGSVTQQRLEIGQAIEQAIALARIGACPDVEFHREGGDGLFAVGDPIQIQQVLVNLIRNSCEALCDSERREVRVSATEGATGARITVEDSGPGIPAEALPTLFATTLSSKSGGMGFGLSICRTIVEAHGGNISGGNLPGGGAVFSFTLPAPAPR